MKKTLKAVLQCSVMFLAVVLVSESARAECELDQKVYGMTEVEIAPSCTVRVRPSFELLMSQDYRERDYAFSPLGRIFVFIGTFDHELDSQSNGSRVFYAIPRQSAQPNVIYSARASTIELTTAAGLHAVFDAATAELLRLDGLQYEIDPIAHIDTMNAEQGGIRIKPTQGLLIDFGWRLGGTPEARPETPATVSYPDGRTCALTVADFVNPSAPSLSIRFDTDAELLNFLATRCASPGPS